MTKSAISLLTLDYPPNRGGVARYLYELVRVSHNAISVLDANKFFRKTWPRWWPLVDVCFEEGRKGHAVFVNHVFPVGTAALIARITGGPEYIVMFHGKDVRLANGAWKRWLFCQICRRASAVIANSDATATDVKKIARNIDVLVLTPGVDSNGFPSREDARRALNLDLQERVVLSVCRLVPRKGIDVSLHAMSRIQLHQYASYVVVGDGPDRPRLEKIAAEHRCRVRWVTDADDAETRLWFAAADVFLLPVRDDGSDVEGFGIVYLEAAAAGIPSIAGKSGGAVEAVRHERTGLTVHPHNVDEIEKAIERLLGDSTLRKQLGEEGKRRVRQDFRWEDRWVKLAERIQKTS